MAKLTYNPGVFAAADLESARRIILTRERDMDTDTRWARETPYLAELIGERLGLRQGMLVLDYGCGVGRLAKALIERCGCAVLGVDISQEMRGLAPGYVGSGAFSVVSRRILEGLVARGLRVDAALSVWVLQHCLEPRVDMGLIRAALAPGAPLAVVNSTHRAVPTVEKPWARDGHDIRQLLAETFSQTDCGGLDPEVVGEYIASWSFWGALPERLTAGTARVGPGLPEA